MEKFLRPDKFACDTTLPDSCQQWLYWERTFSNFITALEIEQNTPLGDAAKLQLLTNHLAPQIFFLVSDCSTYADALQQLQKTYVKPKNEIYARHCLASRRQQPGETLDVYMQALQQLSKDCNFRNVTAEESKNEYIRDAFINGITSSQIRERLLENSNLNLDQIFDQARALEMAHVHSCSFNSSLLLASNESNLSASTKVNKCYFCGSIFHPRFKCPALKSTCNNCGKKGHFSKVCQSKSKQKLTASSTSNDAQIESVSGELSSSLKHVTAASFSCLSKATIQIFINGHKIDALVDTGSSLSFINKPVSDECGVAKRPSSSSITMASTNHNVKVQESCTADVRINEHVYPNFTFLIMDNLCADAILGHDILKSHSYVELSFGGPRTPLKICSLAVASVRPVSLFTNLSKECRPIAIKSRRHTVDDEGFIKVEVDKMLKEGIIQPSNSPWRAQVLVTSSPNHKKRMVIDYSLTVNKFTELDAYPLPRIDDIINKVSQYQVFSTIDLKSAYHQIPIVKQDRKYTAFEACGNLYQFCRIPFGVTNGVSAFQRVMDSLIRTENLQGTFAYLDDVTVCGKDQADHDQNLHRFMELTKKYNLTLNNEKCNFSSTSVTLLGYIIKDKTIRPDPERLRPMKQLTFPSDLTSLRRIIGLFSHYSKWISHFSDKIRPLVLCKSLPPTPEVMESFEKLKFDILNSVVVSVDYSMIFTVETDASDFAIAATLSQGGRPVAFFSRSLSDSEKRHSAVEKEAYAIIESVRKWRHFLLGRYFRLVTDQKSVSFMFDSKHGKVKNEKIIRWRLELSCYKYDIVYRPGKQNIVADTFSRVTAAVVSTSDSLLSLHQKLCHPGITRMVHWVRSKNLPFSVEEIKRITSQCSVCAELKPRFCKSKGTLIKATSCFERLNIDFKGPLPSATRNRYILTIVDEYSRFPFAFPCPDVTSKTVIDCLLELFSVFGNPSFIHSDRGSSFMSKELKSFLMDRGVATSRTTAYNPAGNGQVERYNGVIWKTVELALKTKNIDIKYWEYALNNALHCIRSLLCTATNVTPHERMFHHSRRSVNGSSLPTWLTSNGPVFLRRHVRENKYEPVVEQVQLLEANPEYSYVRLPDGRETTVSNRYLAPIGKIGGELNYERDMNTENVERDMNTENVDSTYPVMAEDVSNVTNPSTIDNSTTAEDPCEIRRSLRERKPPSYLNDYYCELR